MEYIKCAICGQMVNSITWKHLAKHDLTVKEYKILYPFHPMRSPEADERKKDAARRANLLRKGVPRSTDVKNKISASKTQNPTQAWNKGIPLTTEQKQHLSNVRKLKYATGELTHWNVGNVTPDETKQKISNTLKSKHLTMTPQSLARREATYNEKKRNGWVHPSTRREGESVNLSEESRYRIIEASTKTNNIKRASKVNRITQLLNENNLELVSIDDDHYLYTIRCNQCNTTFTRTPSVLVQSRYEIYKGEYCPECYPTYTGYYSRRYFEERPHMKDVDGVLYVAEGKHEKTHERFVKVGITSRTAHRRLQYEQPYEFIVIKEVSIPLFAAFELEQHILRKVSDRYTPVYEFGGSTECFSMEALGTVLDLVNTGTAI